MAFAIYYFKDKTVEVGKISWMSTDDQQQCPKVITKCPDLEEEDDGWMETKCVMKGRKKSDGPAFFPAKVLMVGDNYSDLCKKRQEFIKGKDIWEEATKRKSKPKSKGKDVEEDHEVPSKKKRKKSTCAEKQSANQMIEELKKQLANKISSESTNSNEESSDEEQLPRNWSGVQKKVKELKREIKSLKADHGKEILHAMRELPAVVTTLKEIIEKLTVQISTPTSTWSTPTPTWSTPTPDRQVCAPASPQVLSDPDDMVPLTPGSDVKVPRLKLKSLRTASSTLYIGDLAVLIYGKDTLSNSSVTGRKSRTHKNVKSKPQLDKIKLDAIFVVVNHRGFARDVTASMLPIVLPLSYHSVLFSLTGPMPRRNFLTPPCKM
ncbi:uncharacterized protein LOC143138067 isoform X2 [Alosa pseudoharengus]|uniref:uncharacterized protein LOC143138067 isoform X2 n=1 Tax=Alosa pseudoharengus TaxID=34774 RepID=UPI003F8AFE7A